MEPAYPRSISYREEKDLSTGSLPTD